MSKAVVFTEYGPPDVLHVVEVEPPTPGPGEVRVRMRAAGVQPFDVRFVSGGTASFLPANFPQRVGGEFAGVIDEVGPDVNGFAVGDEVLGWVSLLAVAEQVVVPAGQIVTKPAELPWPEAGALTASGQTAATVLTDLGIGPNDTVLMHAASGGVGSYAVQIAVARGATVIGTAGPGNQDFLRSLGAIPVNYGPGLVDRVRAAAPQGVTAAVAFVGTQEALDSSIELVADKQRIGTITGHPDAEARGVRRLGTRRSVGQLVELTDLYVQGKLKVFIAGAFPLAEAASAFREVADGHVRGKVVITAG
jgi:enoyl reductase